MFENVANFQQARPGFDNNVKINRSQSPAWALPWAPWKPAQEIREIYEKSNLDFKYIAWEKFSRAVNLNTLPGKSFPGQCI